jgi:hypothetical protein
MRGMPRAYWLWFWGGFFVFMASAYVSWSSFNVSGTASGVVGLIAWGVWLVMIVVGVWVSASHIGIRVFSFWWSLAAFASVLLRVVTGLMLTQATREWYEFAGVLMVGIWLLGGGAVVAMWVVRTAVKKRSGESTDRP